MNVSVRQLTVLLPVLVLGVAAAAASSAVNVIPMRIGLDAAAVLATAVAAAWVATSSAEAAASNTEPLPARQVQAIARDRRKPTFDRDTGLHAEWYFRLRVDEEIARARRYGQAFTLLIFSAVSSATLDVARVATKQFLREVDFAGDLGDGIVICLPNTPRDGAQQVLGRLAKLIEGLEITIAEFPTNGETLSALLGRSEWSVTNETAWIQPDAA